MIFFKKGFEDNYFWMVGNYYSPSQDIALHRSELIPLLILWHYFIILYFHYFIPFWQVILLYHPYLAFYFLSQILLDQTWSQQNISVNDQKVSILDFCGSYGLCYNYLTLPLWHESSQRTYICKGRAHLCPPNPYL